MKHYIWRLDDKTNVPFKILETENTSEFELRILDMIDMKLKFAARSE